MRLQLQLLLLLGGVTLDAGVTQSHHSIRRSSARVNPAQDRRPDIGRLCVRRARQQVYSTPAHQHRSERQLTPFNDTDIYRLSTSSSSPSSQKLTLLPLLSS